jgi:hypothetical protein
MHRDNLIRRHKYSAPVYAGFVELCDSIIKGIEAADDKARAALTGREG